MTVSVASEAPPPAAPPGELRHRRALVLRDVAVREREAPLGAEPLRAHLVGADARGDGELARVDRLLDDRGRQVDVTGGHDHLRPPAEQPRGAGLGHRGLVALRIAREEPEIHALASVHLRDPVARRRERRSVERRHRAVAVVGVPDGHRCRLLRCRAAAGDGHRRGGRGHDEREHGCSCSSHLTLLGLDGLPASRS